MLSGEQAAKGLRFHGAGQTETRSGRASPLASRLHGIQAVVLRALVAIRSVDAVGCILEVVPLLS